MIKASAVVVSLLAVVILAGCSKGMTKEGTLYKMNIARELESYFSIDMATVHKAAVAAVKDEGYTIDKDAIDAREGVVGARTAKDRVVRVETYKQGDKVTKIEVYVGGDAAAALALLNRIEARAK